jgi:hypothetical protein
LRVASAQFRPGAASGPSRSGPEPVRSRRRVASAQFRPGATSGPSRSAAVPRPSRSAPVLRQPRLHPAPYPPRPGRIPRLPHLPELRHSSRPCWGRPRLGSHSRHRWRVGMARDKNTGLATRFAQQSRSARIGRHPAVTGLIPVCYETRRFLQLIAVGVSLAWPCLPRIPVCRASPGRRVRRAGCHPVTTASPIRPYPARCTRIE